MVIDTGRILRNFSWNYLLNSRPEPTAAAVLASLPATTPGAYCLWAIAGGLESGSVVDVNSAHQTTEELCLARPTSVVSATKRALPS